MASLEVAQKIAELAVRRACRLTDAVQRAHDEETVVKNDKSPVTVADFGAQAIVISALKHAFPSDKIVGEENADALRKNSTLRSHVWNRVEAACQSNDGLSSEIGQVKNVDEMLSAIDAGIFEGGTRERFWALDPVDGTLGFLRGGQYAVCLGLIVDFKVKVGVIGCPNLLVDPNDPSKGKGVLFSAIEGHGAFQAPLSDTSLSKRQKIQMNHLTDVTKASFCESVEKGHSSLSENAQIAKLLGISNPPVQMDSQAKYCSIARGDGDIYLRLPVSATYQEKIWDHAAGNIIIHEAGGIVSDMHGNQLDFSHGRTLKNNKGIVATNKSLYPVVLKAVQQVTKVA